MTETAQAIDLEKTGPLDTNRTAGASLPTRVDSKPAVASKRLVAQLNDQWRIINDPKQWILEHRRSSAGAKNSGWRARSFCATKAGLLRCIHEHCGSVDPEAMAVISALPDSHFDYRRGR